METPSELTQLWKDRAAAGEARRFLSKGYQAAVGRLEDRRGEIADGVANPHVTSTSTNHCAIPGLVQFVDGTAVSPGLARQEAFELLALADMAEVMTDPVEDERCCQLNGEGLLHEPSCPEVQDPEDES